MPLRPYQKAASDAVVSFFKGKSSGNGIVVIPTGGGKSHVIADIAHRLDEPILVFCPSREIVMQNFDKMRSIDPFICSVYSASVGRKEIGKVTFATIGSVINHKEDFDVFKYVIIDEAHGVNSSYGMYEEFIHSRADRRVVGLTATPYRLSRGEYGKSMLKFLTRTRPRIFTEVLYYCQVSELVAAGNLAELKYYDLTCINLDMVKSNSTGADYDDKSLLEEYERSGFYDKLTTTTLRVLHPKSGVPRRGVLVFTRFVKEAELLVEKLKLCGIEAAIVTGETPKKQREAIVESFKRGTIQVVANANCLAVGFDYPELDTVIIARPTKSLALFYQMTGRAIRPHKGKDGWIIDLGGSYRRFGKVSDLKLYCPPGTSKWAVYSRGHQLTNVSY